MKNSTFKPKALTTAVCLALSGAANIGQRSVGRYLR